jgi:hypothetical protein
MRASRARHFLFTALMLGSCIAACELLIPLERDPNASHDASTPVDAGPDRGISCGQDLPQKLTQPTGGENVEPIVFAGVRWAYQQGDAGDIFCADGFDLDHLNTRAPLDAGDGGVVACTVDRACAPYPPPSIEHAIYVDSCDLDGGVDNVMPELINRLKSSLTFLQLQLPDPNDVLAKGFANGLLVLTDWNGQRDDDRVTVSIFSALGMEDPGIITDSVVQVQQRRPLIWDGGQDAAWIVDDLSVDQKNTPTLGTIPLPKYEAEGYVRNNVLAVPQLGPGIVGVIPVGRSGLHYRYGTLMALIEPPEPEKNLPYRLTHARLGLWFESSELLSALGSIGVASSQLCVPEGINPTFYSLGRQSTCASLDLPNPEAGSGPDPNAHCSLISMTAHTTYIQSRLSRDDAGRTVVGHREVTDPPCVDKDAGTEFCDDCAWPEPRRCPIPDAATPFADTGVTPKDAGADGD